CRSTRLIYYSTFFFFFSSRRRHTRCYRDWSSDVCSSDLNTAINDFWPTREVHGNDSFLQCSSSCLPCCRLIRDIPTGPGVYHGRASAERENQQEIPKLSGAATIHPNPRRFWH